MDLRDRYIYALTKQERKKAESRKQDSAMIDDMKFALEFLRFNGKEEVLPSDVAAIARVAEFYRKYYKSTPQQEEAAETESREEIIESEAVGQV